MQIRSLLTTAVLLFTVSPAAAQPAGAPARADSAVRVSPSTTYRIRIPAGMAQYGSLGLCPSTPARISADTARDSLTLTVVAQAGDSAAAKAPVSLEVLLRGTRYAVISEGAEGALVRTAPAKSLDGAVVEVARYPSGERVCSLVLRAPDRPAPAAAAAAGKDGTPEQKEEAKRVARGRYVAGLDSAITRFVDEEFVLRTGYEFASADGFESRDGHLQGSVTYNINLGRKMLYVPTWNGWFPRLRTRPFRVSLAANAERTTVLSTRRHYYCRRFDFKNLTDDDRAALGLSDTPSCANPELSDSGDVRYLAHPTFLRPREFATRGAWQVSGVARVETPLFTNRGVFFGPIGAIGFTTDPTGGERRGLGSFARGGASLRQIDTEGREKVSFSAMWGGTYDFRERVQRYDSAFVAAHPEVLVDVPGLTADSAGFVTTRPLVTRSPDGWTYRLMLRPVKAPIYLRGIGQFPRSGRALVSLAVMFEGNLTELIRGIGIPIPDDDEEEDDKDKDQDADKDKAGQ